MQFENEPLNKKCIYNNPNNINSSSNNIFQQNNFFTTNNYYNCSSHSITLFRIATTIFVRQIG